MRGRKVQGSGGVAEFTISVAEFTKNASEGVLLLQEWKIFRKFAIKIPRRMIRGASFKPQAIFDLLRQTDIFWGNFSKHELPRIIHELN